MPTVSSNSCEDVKSDTKAKIRPVIPAHGRLSQLDHKTLFPNKSNIKEPKIAQDNFGLFTLNIPF